MTNIYYKFALFSKLYKSKLEEMISKLVIFAQDTVSETSSLSNANEIITEHIDSEITIQSLSMLEDMYSYLTKQVFKMTEFSSIEKQNIFYSVNLRKEIRDKFIFKVPAKGINYTEINKKVVSTGVGVATGTIGGILIAAISHASIAIPIIVGVAAGSAAFSISYFKVIPEYDNKLFKLNVAKFLSDIKEKLLDWFDKIQEYFEKRIDEIITSF
jgi:hypothetical protein